MLLQVLRNINNYFTTNKNTGAFTIQDEKLTGDFTTPPLVGQYILIELYHKDRFNQFSGSRLNSGIYLVGDEEITLMQAKDETFTGVIYNLVIPTDVLQLTEEIAKNIASTPQTNIVSESFGISSLSRATNKDGQVSSWVEVYGARLNNLPKKMFKKVWI